MHLEQGSPEAVVVSPHMNVDEEDQVFRLALVAALAVAVIATPGSFATARHPATASKRCGSFKYGTDGKIPGPSGITATNVSCWFARAVALTGPAPGWRCKQTIGVRFVCTRGAGTVAFYGE
jgi:hypothetical protein